MGRGRRGVLVSLPYIHSYRDRHGHPRYYYRRPGIKKIPLPGIPGSPEFIASYQAAAEAGAASTAVARKPIGIDRNHQDSVARWVALYLESATFAVLAPDTRRTRRNLLERFRRKNGERSAVTLDQDTIEAMVGKLSPVVARNFLKALRPWLKWCVKQKLRKDNPALAVEKPHYKTDGYNTWPETYVEKYRKQHPVGTKARLAFELLVNTGAARADIVRLGRQHIRGDLFVFRRHKTGVLVEIPILPDLRAVLPDHGSDLTFLLTDFGKPFSDAGFGNWFRDRCNEAKVPVGYSAHGVRKYAATVRADLGATSLQLMAWFGWLTIREAERYTREADRRRLAMALGHMVNASMATPSS